MKKSSRGFMGYIVVIVTFLLIAVMVNSMMNTSAVRRIEYPRLLQLIENKQVSRISIQGDQAMGLVTGSTVAEADFPGRSYDFIATIGNDFILTVRQMKAAQTGASLDSVSVNDLDFSIQYQQPETTPWWLEMLPFVAISLLFFVVWFLMMRSQSGGNSKVMNFGKSRARVNDPAKNKITFADVAGADEEKEELQEMVDFLRNPKAYIGMGARIPKGVLLVGPPGTGKTLLAKAVAGEANVPFFSISGSDFVEMFVGVGASRVRDLFEQAKKAAPSIVFIDEIDAVGRHRGAGLGGGHDEREQTLNQLLVEMDGFAINEGVIVMAATNRRDILDPALLRPGRFDRQVTVNYPDQEGRVAILKVHSKGKPLAADVDLSNIAKRTPFATGAELENVMNEAAILAARARRKEIDQQLLVDAIARVQMGPEKRSHKVNPKDRELVACHESGHAIVGHFLKGCDEVHLITIVPRGQAAGHTLSLPGEEHDNLSRSQLMDQIAMCLGGHAAEDIAMDDIYTGSSSDLKRATELCRRMVTQYGMSEEMGTIYLANDQEVFVGMEFGQSRDYSEEVAAQIDRAVKNLLEKCYQLAKDTLSAHRHELDATTQALLAQETISRKEFLTLMAGGELHGDDGATDHSKPLPTPPIQPAPPKAAPTPAPDKPEVPEGVLTLEELSKK